MSILVDPSAVALVMLLSVRLVFVMYATPLDLFGKAPGYVRVLWCIGFALFLSAAGVGSGGGTVNLEPIQIVEALIGEVAIGLLLGFGLYTAFGVFVLAGRIIDFQSGFSAASLFDPASNQQNPLVGTLLLLLATSLFYLADMHHLLFKGFVYSVNISPVGSGFSGVSAESVIAQFGVTFIFGVMLAAPVIALLMLLDAGIGVMSRTMPQMNTYFLFLPLRSLVGIAALALFLPVMQPVMMSAMESAFAFWMKVV